MSTPDDTTPHTSGAEQDARAAEIAARWDDTDPVVLLIRAERRMDRAAQNRSDATADRWEAARNALAREIRADVAWLRAERARLLAEVTATRVALATARHALAITHGVTATDRPELVRLPRGLSWVVDHTAKLAQIDAVLVERASEASADAP